MDLKYIVLADEAGAEYPVRFPRALSHVGGAHGIMREARHSEWSHVKGWLNPVSAGFADPGTFATSGESESLKMKSRPEDAALLRKCFGGAARVP